mmetsp:Transcript_168502/g.535878  ORF Transcript_168502/g.535878 Transcript_168502/m.535878 type:complete len:155 (-) Transcript_168502:108-572(-)
MARQRACVCRGGRSDRGGAGLLVAALLLALSTAAVCAGTAYSSVLGLRPGPRAAEAAAAARCVARRAAEQPGSGTEVQGRSAARKDAPEEEESVNWFVPGVVLLWAVGFSAIYAGELYTGGMGDLGGKLAVGFCGLLVVIITGYGIKEIMTDPE